MGNYKKFEELPCWQKTKELCSAVFKLINKVNRALDCGYINQSEFKIVYDLASACRMQIKGFGKYLRNYKKV